MGSNSERSSRNRSERETSPAVERRVLIISLLASLAISILAIVWGILAGARIILFDGVYLLLGLLLTWISLRVSQAVEDGPTARHPFGRASLTPFAISLQGLALLGTLIYAAGDAIVIVLGGGSDVAPLSVAVYGTVTAVIGYAVAYRLPRLAGSSELVVVEAAQWKAGAVLSTVMAAGAGAALLFSTMPNLSGVVLYLDPALVLIAVAILLPIPIKLLRSGFNELLEGAPAKAVQNSVHAIVREVQQEFSLGEPIVRMHKIGRRLYLEIDFIVLAGEWDVSDEDQVRRAIISRVEPLGYDLWANVELTTDRRLVE
ncbi:cation transporter [Lysinibacter sp. HNR]|uniref:cation transporter n=1 Tax=Lysinibacter sp. HNR TaxID=3031408 RepID=UPI0024356C11|nr:cation transporter [Lysinibacter sp. HNR]WGD36595.1 cation transporter [Lysinibacter sp. HNR]